MDKIAKKPKQVHPSQFVPTKEEKDRNETALDVKDQVGGGSYDDLHRMVIRDATEEAMERLIRLSMLVGK